MQISSKYLGIIIGILVFVVLASGCISVGGSFLDLSDNSSNFKVNKTINNTYSVDGVSFNCPANWHVETANISGSSMILASPEYAAGAFNFISFAPQFQVQIIPNTDFSNYNSLDNSNDSTSNNIMIGGGEESMGGMVYEESVPIIVNGNFLNYNGISTNNSLSEQEIINIMQNSTDPDWNKISNNTLTIDGRTAYETAFIVNSLMPPIVDKRFEQIIFVKNGNIYIMLLQAQNWDFDKEKQNFDIILNSFKVQ